MVFKARLLEKDSVVIDNSKVRDQSGIPCIKGFLEIKRQLQSDARRTSVS